MTDSPLPASNLRAIDAPVVDSAVVEALESALDDARRGTLTGIAIIKSYRGIEWTHVIAGDTLHHAAAGLNLRVDMLKRTILDMWEAVRGV